MRQHWKHCLLLFLICLVIGSTGSRLPAARSDWENLQSLKPDQLIRVELIDSKSYDGALESVNDRALTLRQATGEKTFSQGEIAAVYVKGPSHRARNFYLGVLIGAVFATPLVLANSRNGWWRSNAWPFGVFLPAGGGIAAAIPTGGWHRVYRAPRRIR